MWLEIWAFFQVVGIALQVIAFALLFSFFAYMIYDTHKFEKERDRRRTEQYKQSKSDEEKAKP